MSCERSRGNTIRRSLTRNEHHNQAFRCRRTCLITPVDPHHFPRPLPPWFLRHLHPCGLANHLSKAPTRLRHAPRRPVRSIRKFRFLHDPCRRRSRQGPRVQRPNKALGKTQCCNILHRLRRCLLLALPRGHIPQGYSDPMGFPLTLLAYLAWLLFLSFFF